MIRFPISKGSIAGRHFLASYGTPWTHLRSGRSALVLCLTLGVGASCQEQKLPQHDEPRFTLESENPELERQMSRADREISLRRANLFHYKFVTTCMSHLPNELQVQYLGHLGTDSGRRGQRFNDPEATPFVEWHVHDGIVVFVIRVLTEETKDTLVTCRIDDRDLFISVPFVNKNRSVDAKLAELGDQSVREVLKHLAGESSPEK